MTKKRPAPHTVAEFCRAMETTAPTAFAQDWDNVGLLAGDPAAPVKKILLCIDLSEAVVAEAVARKADVIMAYHPPIFRPVRSVRADSGEPDAAVFRCIAEGIAVYSTHTALDAAEGGTNDVIAGLCGAVATEPLEYVNEPGEAQSKIVVFAPEAEVDTVTGAMFDAGAGHIGDYSCCAYRLSGKGSFLGGDATNPTIGKRGRLEFVNEQRVEMVVTDRALPRVIEALVEAHSYEEPAFDVYSLRARPRRGIGRKGDLPRPVSLKSLARSLKRKTRATGVQIVGDPEQLVSRVIVAVGAAGSLPLRAGVAPGDVVVTGEMRHHDGLTVRRRGCAAVTLGHWASERPALDALATRLEASLRQAQVFVSERDADPFASA